MTGNRDASEQFNISGELSLIGIMDKKKRELFAEHIVNLESARYSSSAKWTARGVASEIIDQQKDVATLVEGSTQLSLKEALAVKELCGYMSAGMKQVAQRLDFKLNGEDDVCVSSLSERDSKDIALLREFRQANDDCCGKIGDKLSEGNRMEFERIYGSQGGNGKDPGAIAYQEQFRVFSPSAG